MSAALYSRFGKPLLIVEVAGLVGAYYVFHELNTNQDARQRFRDRAPYVLDAFLKATGKEDDTHTRGAAAASGPASK